MPLLTKLRVDARVVGLFRGADRDSGLEKPRADLLDLTFAGIAGDSHAGLTRAADSRTLGQYPRGTEIRNTRQVTLVAEEELAEIAARLGLAALSPEWFGANMLIAGLPRLTQLPPSARVQFPSGATLTVDMENAPCREVADVVARYHPEAGAQFVTAASGRRGVTAWVEREGTVRPGDRLTVWIPPQRLYRA